MSIDYFISFISFRSIPFEILYQYCKKEIWTSTWTIYLDHSWKQACLCLSLDYYCNDKPLSFIKQQHVCIVCNNPEICLIDWYSVHIFPKIYIMYLPQKYACWRNADKRLAPNSNSGTQGGSYFNAISDQIPIEAQRGGADIYVCLRIVVGVFMYLFVCVFVYLCFCVFVFLRICVFVYLCFCGETHWSMEEQVSSHVCAADTSRRNFTWL